MKYLLILFFIAVVISGCSAKRVKPLVDANLNIGELPSQESWNSVITFTDSGKTKAILWTAHLQKFEQRRETLLDNNLKIDFYNDNQIKTTTLTSKKGRVDETTNDLYAIDSVIVFSDSVTIKTDEMMWKNKDKKIVSNKFVRVISPKETIEGYGFESDQSLRNYIIYKITYVTRTDSV